ncbi:MAG: hypothetical protein AAGJ35_15150, partial [Myxococcota bacterium]
LKWGTEFFFPPRCGGCNCALTLHTEMFCTRCHQGLFPLHRDDCCRLCAAPLETFETKALTRCVTCWEQGLGLTEVSACYAYMGSVAKMLHRWKYRGDQRAGRLLCLLLEESIRARLEQFASFDWLIPVPCSTSALRKRGFSQSWELCKVVKRVFRAADPHSVLLCRPDVLRVKTKNAAQVGKGRSERRNSLSDAFELAPRWREAAKNKKILLVDDVITTGATFSACAKQFPKTAEVHGLSLFRTL